MVLVVGVVDSGEARPFSIMVFGVFFGDSLVSLVMVSGLVNSFPSDS